VPLCSSFRGSRLLGASYPMNAIAAENVQLPYWRCLPAVPLGLEREPATRIAVVARQHSRIVEQRALAEAWAFASGGALQPAADDLAALDQGGDLRQLPRGHLAEPLDGGLVIGRGGQQRPDLIEGEPRPLPGLDYRECAHRVRAVYTPPTHPGRRGQQPDLLVVPDRGRPPARQRGHRADGQSRPGI